MGHLITEFIDPASIAGLMSRIAGLTEPGAVSEPAEAKILAIDGRTRIVQSTSVRTSWQGAPAFQVIMRDLTDSRADEERFTAVVRTLSEGILVFDADQRLTVVNDAARRLLGPVVDTSSTASELFSRLHLASHDGTPLPPDATRPW